jgi:hypothetical protein
VAPEAGKVFVCNHRASQFLLRDAEALVLKHFSYEIR